MKRTVNLFATTIIATTLSGAVLAGGDKSTQDKSMKAQVPAFSELDTDRNGMVSETEIQAARSNAATDKLTENWSELDTNQDGELDRAEFARFEPVTDRSEKARQHMQSTEKGDLEK